MKTHYVLAISVIFFTSCIRKKILINSENSNTVIEIAVLGTSQDAGSPQIGCLKACCTNKFSNPALKEFVVSLGLVDHSNNQYWLFEATPDIAYQMDALGKIIENNLLRHPEGIFITHAHIGHYTGLMYLGKEGMNSSGLSVYVMPRLNHFLINNGPWSQLISHKNITTIEIKANKKIKLNKNLSIEPVTVPHRDEFSETVGYFIHGPNKSVLFIPDIDKWKKWDLKLEQQLSKVQYAFIDGTFFDKDELPGRNISEIPHPFIKETIEQLSKAEDTTKNKIFFIHLNHINPSLNPASKESKWVESQGFHIARTGMKFRI